VSRTRREDHLLFDAGPHGFLNGGHAHSDALSVVVTVAGRPLLIDPGTATYTTNSEVRDSFRDTAMHNTLVLDGRPQSVPRGPFHWKSRASAQAGVWRSSAGPSTGPGQGPSSGSGSGCDYIEGSHDGYLPRRHTRAVLALHGIGWWILDHVLGSGDAEAAIHWHVHPSWRPAIRDGRIDLTHEDGTALAFVTTAAAGLDVVGPGEGPLAVWSPAYGRVEPAPLLVVRLQNRLPQTVATFIAADPRYAARLAIERLAISQTPAGWHTGGWRASWSGGSLTLLAALEAPGASSDAAGSPPASWGTGRILTNARVAAVLAEAEPTEAVIVNGSNLWWEGAALVNLPDVAGIFQKSIRPRLASRVHEQTPVEAGIQ
jgi:hypothetical protein